jgi:hypothetical protein
MAMIARERLTATMDGGFVVFLIGMRVNTLWAVRHWLPPMQAMTRMLAELKAHPELGALGGQMWFGRTTILLQYWRSLEQLFAYATDRDAAHLPAWKAFNRSTAGSGHVGVWHETYSIAPGSYETVYVNMPPFGLGKCGQLVPAAGTMSTARGRVRRREEA